MEMNAYILRFRSRKLFLLALALLSVFPLSGRQFTVCQETHKRDTLLYYWHDTRYNDNDSWFLPKDCYMELYIENGILEKGFFWGTTDEFDHRRGREDHADHLCGYFVLPMTEIRQEKNSISFKLSLIKTEHGEIVDSFVKAPVDLHIRSWQEALARYQKWIDIYGYYERCYENEILFSISFSQKREKAMPHGFPIGDSIIVRNLTIDCGERTFILQKRKH